MIMSPRLVCTNTWGSSAKSDYIDSTPTVKTRESCPRVILLFAEYSFRLILPLPGAPDETEEEEEAGRDAISRAPELDALGGLPTISEEDRYFPLRVDTPRMKSGDVVVTPPMARPPPLPSRPDYEDLYT